MSSQREEQNPEPQRPFQGWLDRANAGIAALHAAADASTAESMRRLRRTFAPLAFLDSPWLLLLSVPGLLGLSALREIAILPPDVILAIVVTLAGRRWGTAVLTPTLLLCLLELVQFPWLQGFGNLATIPLLLIAARVGYDPGFLAALQRCTSLTRIDYLLLLALTVAGNWYIIAFKPDFIIGARTTSILFLIFLLLGAANVSRIVLLVPVTGFVMQLLLHQLEWWRPFFTLPFGVYLTETLTCIALFEAARSIRAGPDAGLAKTGMHRALFLMVFLLAALGAKLRYSLPFDLSSTSYTVNFNFEMVVALAISAWSYTKLSVRAAIAMFVTMGFIVLAYSSVLAETFFGLLPEPEDSLDFALWFDQPTTSPYETAVALLLICTGTIFALERWHPRGARPAPLLSGSFMVTLLGQFWSGAAAIQAVFLLAVAVALALVGPFPQLDETNNTTDSQMRNSGSDIAVPENQITTDGSNANAK